VIHLWWGIFTIVKYLLLIPWMSIGSYFVLAVSAYFLWCYLVATFWAVQAATGNIRRRVNKKVLHRQEFARQVLARVNDLDTPMEANMMINRPGFYAGIDAGVKIRLDLGLPRLNSAADQSCVKDRVNAAMRELPEDMRLQHKKNAWFAAFMAAMTPSRQELEALDALADRDLVHARESAVADRLIMGQPGGRFWTWLYGLFGWMSWTSAGVVGLKAPPSTS